MKSDVCSEPLKAGNCRAALYRYGFDKTKNQCVLFIFGGCEANGNNFHTLKDCLEACKPSCLQPLKTGRCRAGIPRFGFSSEENKCVQFIYGGCDANENNFPTLEECQTQCEVKEDQPKLIYDHN